MSNYIRFVAAVVCISAISPPLFAQATATKPAETEATKEVSDLPPLDDIKTALQEIRGLDFKRDVPFEKKSVEGWKETIEAEIDAAFPQEEQDAMVAGLMRLGMLTEPIDFGGEFIDAMLSQAAAFYDPETGTFYYLMSDMPLMMLQTVASHELVHALQDQHFDLGKITSDLEAMLEESPRNDDALHAARFLIEGEATYVQTLWQMQEMGMDLADNPEQERMSMRMMANMDIDQLVKMAAAQGGMPGMGDDDGSASIREAMAAMDEIPPYIIGPLYAAYMKGAYFSMMLRQDGGWERVAQAFKELPMSTEQTLHPEKFLEQRDNPTRIELPEFAALKSAGWTMIDSAIHGELYLNILLRNFNVDKMIADKATAGWDGDIYQAWRNDAGDVGMVFATTWDSEDDAKQFFDAYRNLLMTKEKYPNFEFDFRVSQPEQNIVFDCGDGQGAGRLWRRDRDVFAVEGFSADITSKILTDLNNLRIEQTP